MWTKHLYRAPKVMLFEERLEVFQRPKKNTKKKNLSQGWKDVFTQRGPPSPPFSLATTSDLGGQNQREICLFTAARAPSALTSTSDSQKRV